MAARNLDLREPVAQVLHLYDRERAIMEHREHEVPTWTLLSQAQREEYCRQAELAIAEIRRQLPEVNIQWVDL